MLSSRPLGTPLRVLTRPRLVRSPIGCLPAEVSRAPSALPELFRVGRVDVRSEPVEPVERLEPSPVEVRRVERPPVRLGTEE